MTLRRKILTVVVGVFVVLAAVLFLISRTVLLDGYRALEVQDLNHHLYRVQSSLENEWETLDTTVNDWASWDDAYAFVVGENRSFVETNLVDHTFGARGFRLNLMMFLNTDQEVVYARGYDWQKEQEHPIPAEIQPHLTGAGIFHLRSDTSAVKGVLRLDNQLLLVAARAILTSEEEGPGRGTLIMGRTFDGNELGRLGELLRLDLRLLSLDNQLLVDQIKPAMNGASHEAFAIQELPNGHLGGDIVIHDIYDRPAAMIRAAIPRTIYRQGIASGNYLMAVVIGVSLVFVVVLVIVLDKWVLSRLTEMNKRVASVEGAEGLATRLPVEGNDELANFSRALNDMLERARRTEKELIRLERLSALGELAAGINHNLNNILVGVTVSSEFLLEDVDDPEIREHVETIFRAGRQAGDLVARLQDAMLGESDEGVLRSVNEVILEAIESAKPRWKDEAELKGRAIDMVMDLAPDLPTIRGSSSGLYNLVLNLIFNAVDAMPQGGSIGIQSVAVADGIQLTFRDTGVGMTEDIAKRVFEPFFTTKAQIGTGLGLSTVYNTVIGWGGKIDVDTVPGAGTVFTLWLPAELHSGDDFEGVFEASEGIDGRILVVDDQDVVTDLIQDILSPPHQVTCTHSGHIAQDLLKVEDYDVVMIDLGMPGVPGDQVAKNIRTVAPDVALVLITGWRLSDGDDRLALFDFHLRKPLSNLDGVRDVIMRAVRLRRVRQQEIG